MATSEKELLEMLQKKYNRSVLTKREAAAEIGIAYSTLTKRMAEGIDCPDYIKNGTTAATRVIFPITSIAEYLTRTIKVM